VVVTRYVGGLKRKKICRSTGKHKFASYENAIRFLAWTAEKEKDEYEPLYGAYRCPKCGSWHTTSNVASYISGRRRARRRG
jgi:hypothetical protein